MLTFPLSCTTIKLTKIYQLEVQNMEFTCRTRTLQALSKNIAKSKILLSHELQRKEGAWSPRQKSDLIDSLLRNYPINPTYSVKDDGVLAIIDGVQRLSTIRDFLDSKFALSKTLKPVMINGEEKDIAGLRFKKMDDDTKEALLNSELQIYEITEYTDEDVREMFRRQNAGTALKPSQKLTSSQSRELTSLLFELSSYPFIQKVLTPAQIKKDVDRDICREVLMLSEVSKDNTVTSFRAKDMEDFVSNYEIDDEKVENIKSALIALDEAFDDNVKIPKTSISFIIYAMMRTIKDNKSTEKLIEIINDFLANYESNDEYKQYCLQGTSNNVNVVGRLDYWRNVVKTL